MADQPCLSPVESTVHVVYGALCWSCGSASPVEIVPCPFGSRGSWVSSVSALWRHKGSEEWRAQCRPKAMRSGFCWPDNHVARGAVNLIGLCGVVPLVSHSWHAVWHTVLIICTLSGVMFQTLSLCKLAGKGNQILKCYKSKRN